MEKKPLAKLVVTVLRDDYEKALGQFAILFNFGWEESENGNDHVFTVYCENREFLENAAKNLQGELPGAVIALSSVELPDPLESWKEFFTPVECGQLFVIVPPWLADGDFGSRHKIIINPKSAFGTGHHASTCLCLRMLDWLLRTGQIEKNDSFFDLGCGTGVLGIAASLAGLSGAAADIDPLAMENARENSAANKSGLNLLTGDERLIEPGKYNLIMANILARPLIEMAPALSGGLKRNGCLILSGILRSQSEEVKNAYLERGLVFVKSAAADEWEALTLKKPDKSD